MNVRSILLGILGCAGFLPAAPVDLDSGLLYVRGDDHVTLAPDDRAVVDLRFIPPSTTAPAWATAPDSTAKIVLLAGDSAPAWAALLERRSPRVLLLAPTGALPVDELTLALDPADLTAVVHAIDTGHDVRALARPAVDKPRFDESALVRHHNGDGPPPTAATADQAEADDAAPTPPAAPLTDPMLARAVQVLLGLRAMGKG